METLTNIANAASTAASKAIWGTHEEPVSGRMGNVAADQPYDAGNIEPTSTALKTTDPNPEVEVNHAEEPNSYKHKDLGATERSFNTSANPTAPGVALPPPTPSEKAREPPLSSTATDARSKHEPAKTTSSSHLPTDSTKAQNDTRSPSDPTTKPDGAHQKNNVDDAEGGLDVNNNPVKIDGPGPRPIEELAKERGGDAGNVGKDQDRSRSAGSVSTEEDEDRKDSGTGELYVRSSGLAADGGDFDARKPGAGREADRLLEKKGIHHGNKTGSDGSAAVGAGYADKHHVGGDHHVQNGHHKPSLKEKIKAKLHRKSVS